MACISETVPLRLKRTEIWHIHYSHSNIYRKPILDEENDEDEDEENNVCLQIIHKITRFPYFFLIHQKQKQPNKAVICVRTL